MTADEARTIATESKAVQLQMTTLIEKINKACAGGQFAIRMSGQLRRGVIDELKRLGYVVEHYSGDQREPANTTTLSWL
jgi:hypothetical protein